MWCFLGGRWVWWREWKSRRVLEASLETSILLEVRRVTQKLNKEPFVLPEDHSVFCSRLFLWDECLRHADSSTIQSWFKTPWLESSPPTHRLHRRPVPQENVKKLCRAGVGLVTSRASNRHPLKTSGEDYGVDWVATSCGCKRVYTNEEQ